MPQPMQTKSIFYNRLGTSVLNYCSRSRSRAGYVYDDCPLCLFLYDGKQINVSTCSTAAIVLHLRLAWYQGGKNLRSQRLRTGTPARQTCSLQSDPEKSSHWNPAKRCDKTVSFISIRRCFIDTCFLCSMISHVYVPSCHSSCNT